MESPLPRRLVQWCQRLGDPELLMAASLVAGHGNPLNIPRNVLENVRDRLDRAQERNQFSGKDDQTDLAEVVAGIDGLLKKIPAN